MLGKLGFRGFAAATFISVSLLAPAQANILAAPPYFASDQVQFVENIPTGAQAIGGKVIGHYFYLTTYQDVEIFDVSTPEAPRLVGKVAVNVERENEEAATNGRILATSSSMGCQYFNPATDQPAPADGRWEGTPLSCLELFDVRDPANPTLLTHVMGAGQHTSTCLYDCAYMWGQYGGEVTDLRHVFDSGHPAAVIGNWMDHLPTIPMSCPGTNGDVPATHSCDLSKVQCHNVEETAPGLVFAACQPILLLSARAEDGADPVHPKVLAYGGNDDGRFIHSARWPNAGTDTFALVGGETNGVPRCDQQQNAPLMTFVRDSQTHLRLVDEFHLQDGNYSDGNPPVHTLGCSVHWFQEHPTFHNGGLISLAAYDNGVRFVQVQPSGKIVERGFFNQAGSATWAAYWAPDGRTVYAVDDNFGIDVIRWKGPFYAGATAGATTTVSPAPTPASTAAKAPLPNTAPGGPGLPPPLLVTILAACAALTIRLRRFES